MNKNIKVGDLVETCSLMAGVVMKINGDTIEARMLDVDNYSTDSYAQCSLSHCGIVKLNAQQAKQRLLLGKEKLASIWGEFAEADYDFGSAYDKRVEEEYNKIIK